MNTWSHKKHPPPISGLVSLLRPQLKEFKYIKKSTASTPTFKFMKLLSVTTIIKMSRPLSATSIFRKPVSSAKPPGNGFVCDSLRTDFHEWMFSTSEYYIYIYQRYPLILLSKILPIAVQSQLFQSPLVILPKFKEAAPDLSTKKDFCCLATP